MNQIAINPPS